MKLTALLKALSENKEKTGDGNTWEGKPQQEVLPTKLEAEDLKEFEDEPIEVAVVQRDKTVAAATTTKKEGESLDDVMLEYIQAIKRAHALDRESGALPPVVVAGGTVEIDATTSPTVGSAAPPVRTKEEYEQMSMEDLAAELAAVMAAQQQAAQS